MSFGDNHAKEILMDGSCRPGGAICMEEPGCFVGIDFELLTTEDIKKFHFVDLDAAYDFYNEYGRIKGFSSKRSKAHRNGKRKIVIQQFLCSREGKWEIKYLEITDYKKEPKKKTRCDYNARIWVHMNNVTRHWYVITFDDNHNHELLSNRFRGMLRSYRIIKDGDMYQINSMRRVSLTRPKIYGSLVSQLRGYNMVGFNKKDIYNEIDKERGCKMAMQRVHCCI